MIKNRVGKNAYIPGIFFVSAPSRPGVNDTSLCDDLLANQILASWSLALPPAPKVAVCLRTKDYARFLPEWIAFHYAIGVDEFVIYDDNSVDNTTEVLKPFVEAGIVQYIFEVIHR